MKCKQWLAALLICCTPLLSSFPVHADTDGTEMQVSEPVQMEIQLGPSWAGVEFQLKTDAGIYPGVIAVDETGVLRTELGGSRKYILSCLDSPISAPITPTDAEDSQPVGPDTSTPEETSDNSEQDSVPASSILFFGIGMAVAVGSLIILQIIKKRKTEQEKYLDDDEEE